MSKIRKTMEGAQVMGRSRLTKAELRVLNGIVSGASNEQMASVMRTKTQTIKNQVASILRKYRVKSRSALIVATLKEDRIRWDHARCEWFQEATQ